MSSLHFFWNARSLTGRGSFMSLDDGAKRWAPGVAATPPGPIVPPGMVDCRLMVVFWRWLLLPIVGTEAV